MTAIPTERIKCPVRKGVTHAPTFLSGHCAFGPYHASCRGHVTNGCGCVIPCRCTEPGHPEDRTHLYEETPVQQPDPFTIPDLTIDAGPGTEAAMKRAWDGVRSEPTTELHEAVTDWADRIEPRARPWVDGTGEPGTLEVMVRCFAMAAGDLHLISDDYDDYDETAHLAMLAILRAGIRRAQEFDATVVAWLHEHGTWGRRTIDGIGEVRTYRRPKNTKWDDYGTAYAVVDHHMEELGGEQPDPHEVVRWVLEAGAIDYYRVGALEAMGLDVTEYRSQEKGTRAVDVPVPD